MEQSRLPDFDPQSEEVIDDWTFANASTNYMSHGLHPYPARMIPQVARKLILRYSKEGEMVWDPFCGSGSVLVESMLTSRKSIGTDLNPFAIFLSKVKTTPISFDFLRNAGREIIAQRLAKEMEMRFFRASAMNRRPINTSRDMRRPSRGALIEKETGTIQEVRTDIF